MENGITGITTQKLTREVLGLDQSHLNKFHTQHETNAINFMYLARQVRNRWPDPTDFGCGLDYAKSAVTITPHRTK